ncbi:MAK10-like protein [Tanacetum coccineum]
MGDENPIRTLGDYSKPSHEGYRNTIELPEGNNVVPLRSDTIRERTRLCFFQFSLRDQASNWLERLPAGSISIWEDLTTRFLAQFFPSGRTAKLCNEILMFQQHQGESLSEAWTHFKDLLQKSLIMASIFGSKSKSFMTMSIPSQGKPSISRLVASFVTETPKNPGHYYRTSPSMTMKVGTTQGTLLNRSRQSLYLKMSRQAFVDYASSRTDKARGKWFTFKPEQNNLGDTYNPSWKSHPNLRWRQPQNSQNNFSNPPNRFQPNSSFSNRSFNNNPQNFNNQSNLEGLVSNFMASQDAILSKFEADFKQQQIEMTNKIDTVLKAITDRITGTLPSDTVKNPKLNINSNTLVLSALLAHAPIYNAILDKYVESLELGKNGSAFIQGEIPKRMEEPGLFTLPCRLGDSEPFDTLADLGSCVNIIPLYLFKKLKIGLLEETDHVFGLADGTKSYPVGIVKDVEVHIRRLKLLNDFYESQNSGRGVKETNPGEEEAPYWTTIGKRESYKPRTSSDGIGAQTPYYARKEFMDCHSPEEWEMARDAKINPFKDVLVFRQMNKPPKDGDGAWHAKIKIIDPDGEEFTKTF